MKHRNSMITRCFRISALLLVAYAPMLNAATVSLNNIGLTNDEVIPGEMFSVSLDLDFTDADGAHPGSFGGAVVIAFNPGLLTLQGFAPSGESVIADELPTVPMQDCADSLVICFVDAPDSASVGTLTFTVNPAVALNEEISIDIADADNFFGSFANQLPTDQAVDPAPDFIGTSVFAVPVPAVAWSMASGLAIFGMFARRRREP